MGLFSFLKKVMARKNSDVKPYEATKADRNFSNSPSELKVETAITTPAIIPVEKRIKSLQPSDQGLYPHEILLLSYAPKYRIEEQSFPGFWWYRYGVKDVHQCLQSLLSRGFLTVGSLQSAMENETVANLKSILRQKELKVSGKKADLIKRLLETVPQEELSKVFSKHTYELTATGADAFNKEKHILYIHRHSLEDLNIWSLTEMVQNHPDLSYRDIIWRYLNERSIGHFKEGAYGLYRNCRLSMSEFVRGEGKIDTAFSLLTEVISYDLSGLSNGFTKEHLGIYARNFFPYEESVVTVAPGITSLVAEYKESKEYTDDKLRQNLLTGLGKFQLPFRVFSPKECVDIVLMEINGDKEGLKSIYDRAQKRFAREYQA